MKAEIKQRSELLLNEIMMTACLIITGATITQHQYIISAVCFIAGIYFYGITNLANQKYGYKPFYYKILPKKTREYYNNTTNTNKEEKPKQEYTIIEE